MKRMAPFIDFGGKIENDGMDDFFGFFADFFDFLFA